MCFNISEKDVPRYNLRGRVQKREKKHHYNLRVRKLPDQDVVPCYNLRGRVQKREKKHHYNLRVRKLPDHVEDKLACDLCPQKFQYPANLRQHMQIVHEKNGKTIQKLSKRELEMGNLGKKSWHDDYKDSAWIFIVDLPYIMTENDIICEFSQYGEVVNINLVRDKATGKSKGYAFLCFKDQLSTVLAVHNHNSIKLFGWTIHVYHMTNYKEPKEHGDEDNRVEGCAPQAVPKEMLPKPSESNEKSNKKKKMKDKKKWKKVKLTMKIQNVSDSESTDSESSSDDWRKMLKKATNWLQQ